MALTATLHTSLDDEALVRGWDALSDTGAGNLFTSRLWCRCWMETVGADQKAHILAAWDDSRLLGVLPLTIRTTRACRYAEIMGARGVAGDHLNWIGIEPTTGGRDDPLSMVLDALGACADVLALNNVDHGSALHVQARSWAKRSGLPCFETPLQPAPVSALPRTFERFLASRSKKMRYHVRKGSRQMQELGGWVGLVQDRDNVPQLIDDFCRIHACRWQPTGRRGSFERPSHQAFLRNFCECAARTGMLRAYVLHAGQAVDGVLIAFHYRGVAYFYQIARLPDSRFESPGVILIGQSIRQAITEGLIRYDFLQGDESYKRRWTSHCVQQTNLFVGLTHAGRFRITAMRAKHGLKRAVDACRSIRQASRDPVCAQVWTPLPTEGVTT